MNKKEKEILLNSYKMALISNDNNLSNHMESLLNSLNMNIEVINIKNDMIINNLPFNENSIFITNSFKTIDNIYKKYDTTVLYIIDDIIEIFENDLIYKMDEDDILIIKNEIKKINRYYTAA